MPTFYLKRTFRLKEPSGSQEKQKTKQKKRTSMMITIIVQNSKKVIHALCLSEIYKL